MKFDQKPSNRRSRRSRAAFAAIVVSATVAAGLAQGPAALAANTTITTGNDLAGLARNANALAFPTGAPSAVVATSMNNAILAQASSYAAARNLPLIVSVDGLSSSGILADIQAVKATTAVLFGTTTSFDAATVAQIGAAVTVDSTLLLDSSFDRSQAIIAQTQPTREVVSDSIDPTNLRLASGLSAMKGDPLILLDGTETDDQLASMFPSDSTVRVTVLGTNLPNLTALTEQSQSATIGSLPTTDPIATEIAIADQAVSRGAKANDIYTAPSDQPGSFAITAAAAHAAGVVAISAGAASTLTTASAVTSDLKLWGAETAAVRLFGLGVTTAQANSLAAPTTVARAAAPGWRVMDTTVGTSNWTIRWNAAANAKSYKLYDVFGTQLASTTALSATISGQVQSLSVAALDSAGKEFARFEYAVNDYKDTASRADAVIGSVRKGTTWIQFLGGPKVPRVVTRTMIDPFDLTKAPVITQVAITCKTWFAESGLDATKEYDYDVATEGNSDNRACNAAAPADAADPEVVHGSAVSLPNTEFPATPGATAASSKTVQRFARAASASATNEHAAIPTVSQFQVMQATGTVSKGVAPQMTTLRAAAQGRAVPTSAAATQVNERIRYQGFIPEQYVWFPTKLTHDLSHPIYAFGGNGHNAGLVNGSYKFREDVLFDFNAKRISEVSDTGVTHGYKCKVGYRDCIDFETAQADPASAANITDSRFFSSTSAYARVNVHTKIPLVSYAPAIDASIDFFLSPGHSVVVGWHDGMPVHEYYTAAQYPNSDYSYNFRYYSKRYWLPCLFPQPFGCRVYVNRNL